MGEPEVRLALCEARGSEGRIYSGHPNDPHPRDEGQFPVCEGTGRMLVEVEPVAPDGMASEDAEANAPAEWMSCRTRRPWVTNSLGVRIKEMRNSERRCRKAFRKPWMGEPAEHLAGIYGEMAELLERRLAELEAIALRPHPYEAAQQQEPADG